MLRDIPSSVLDFLNIVDVQLCPRDFIFGYWGKEFTKLLGYNLTGKSFREVKPEAFALDVEKTLEEVCSRKTPILFGGEYMSQTELIAREFILRLPFSTDNVTVDKIASIVWTDAKPIIDWAV